jgi:hypothetical protein
VGSLALNPTFTRESTKDRALDNAVSNISVDTFKQDFFVDRYLHIFWILFPSFGEIFALGDT